MISPCTSPTPRGWLHRPRRSRLHSATASRTSGPLARSRSCGIRTRGSQWPSSQRTCVSTSTSCGFRGPDVVIEIGAYRGGSALWFRDRLRTLAGYGRSRNPRIISLELDAAPALSAIAGADPGFAASITVVEGDVRDERSARAVERLVPSGARCMVVEDSAHTFETTIAALANFSPSSRWADFSWSRTAA
jgi:Cephalosporin hydroxylase